MRRLSMYERRRLFGIGSLRWENCVNNSKVVPKILGWYVQPPEEALTAKKLRRLSRVLRAPTERLLLCTLFTEAHNDCRMILDGQSITWANCMKALISGIAHVAAGRLRR